MYEDKSGNRRAEIVEIKPSSQSTMEAAGNNNQNKLSVVVNTAKWQAAQIWCRRQQITFRVITEKDIFRQGQKR